MVRHFIVVLLALASSAMLVAMARAQEPQRFALLIGNQRYAEAVGPLKNPGKDIALIKSALLEIGFPEANITTVADADRVKMLEAFDEFAEQVRSAGPGAVSFFYYSGHGAANEGRDNFLIPVDVPELSASGFWYRSVNLREVLDRLNAKAPYAKHFVIFDACRNTLKLKGKATKSVLQPRGFQAVHDIPGGMLIAFATAEGELASDGGNEAGPYAQALAAEIRKPGVEAITVFRNAQLRVGRSMHQTPWFQSSPMTEVYFAGQETPRAKPQTGLPASEPAGPAPDRFAISGSTTIGDKLMPALIRGYARANNLTVNGGECDGRTASLVDASGRTVISIVCRAKGSRLGFEDLFNRQADIAMTSDPVDEIEGIPLERSEPLEPYVLALDGVAVIVTRGNPVTELTLEQIASIFAGEITDWSELGFAPGKINLYVRDENSGTRDVFEKNVMVPNNKKILDRTLRRADFDDGSELSRSVAADPMGIGFAGYAYLDDVKALSIREGCGLVQAPSSLTIRTEDYPLFRRLYLYTRKAGSLPSGAAGKFLDYALGELGQSVARAAKFADQSIELDNTAWSGARVAEYNRARWQKLKAEDEDLQYDANCWEDLKEDVQGATRLSVSYRFRTDISELDAKAKGDKGDAGRLARYLKAPGAVNKQVLLLGFADAKGTFEYNHGLSRRRAEAVKRELRLQGVPADRITTAGYGELMPVACNLDEKGRGKNRRVEAWILPGRPAEKPHLCQR